MLLIEFLKSNSLELVLKPKLSFLASFLIIGLISACDSSDPNGAGNSYGAAKTSKKTIKIEDGKSTTSTSGTTDGDGDGDGEDDPVVSQDDRDAAIEKAKAARAFFTDTVVTQFETSCYSCHAPPREFPDPAGPLSIYDYDLMKAKLAGTSSLNNSLMDKTRAQVSHAGGSACGVDVRKPPCSLIMEWWDLEFSTGEVVSEAGLAGEIELVSVKGTLYGYAASVLDTAATLEVNFYIGGDKGAGGTQLFVGTPVMAEKSGYSGGVQGPHRFQVDLPEAYANGTTQELFIYAKLDGKEVALKGSPFSFKAWTPKGDDAFYMKKFEGCGCHSRNYVGDFSVLGSPSPNDGGTRTNNKLFKVGAGGHSGGGYDTGFVSSWWDFEFN